MTKSKCVDTRTGVGADELQVSDQIWLENSLRISLYDPTSATAFFGGQVDQLNPKFQFLFWISEKILSPDSGIRDLGPVTFIGTRMDIYSFDKGPTQRWYSL